MYYFFHNFYQNISSICYYSSKSISFPDVDKYVVEDKLYIPYLMWVCSNIIPVLIGATLVAYIEVHI